MGEAFDWLRKRGAAKASDLGERDANEGLVAVISNDFEASMLQVVVSHAAALVSRFRFPTTSETLFLCDSSTFSVFHHGALLPRTF
jgi:hypothetical protein